MKELRNYIYMDMIGIDSLLSQITSELIETNHIQTTNRKMGTAKGNIGISELVRKIFKADATLSEQRYTRSVKNQFYPLLRCFHSVSDVRRLRTTQKTAQISWFRACIPLFTEGSLSGELESVQVIDKTTTLPYEAKIEQIITYIKKHKILLKNKIDITQNYQEEKQNLYC